MRRNRSENLFAASIAASRAAAETDDALLERTRRGDRFAFAPLATRYWGAVQRIAWHMVPDPAAAAKIVEAVFLAVLEAGDSFPEDVSFKTSLYRVTLGQSWRRLEDLPASGASGVVESSGAEQIREALLRLDPLDRAAILLREVGQLSAGEAAAVLGITPASIHRRTHLATLALMKPLGLARTSGLRLAAC